MPYKFESKRIPRKFDKRVKVSDIQRQEIIDRYSTKSYTQQDLAIMYNVSRSTIRFILNPSAYEENKANHKTSYTDKQKQREAINRHRDYKKELDKRGLLIQN